MISDVMSCRGQDCVAVLAPYPNNSNPVESLNVKTDYNLTGDGLVWYARPQLFFNCTLCPTGLKATIHSGSHKEVSLVYFSTFEPIDLTPDRIMQRAGVPMLDDSASNLNPRLPCLYICPVAKCWGTPPSFRASSAATVTPLSHTASRTIGVLFTPPPTRSGIGATAAGSTR
jgi:hypothetical protein